MAHALRARTAALPGHGFWHGAFCTVAAVTGYLFMEWTYLVGRPSFLSSGGPMESIVALTGPILPLAALALAIYGCLFLVLRFPCTWRAQGAQRLALTVPALLVTLALLLFADNIVSHAADIYPSQETSPIVIIYWLFLLGVFAGLSLWFIRGAARVSDEEVRRNRSIATAILVLSALSLCWAWFSAAGSAHWEVELPPNAQPRTNVLLVGSDGMPATHLSVYGYERNTTPELAKRAHTALLAENAFTNSGNTIGATTAMVTGRLPTDTKVFFQPHSLQGSDSLHHLPGTLRRLGYRTQQETARYVADGIDLGWTGAFDEANGRRSARWRVSPAGAQLGARFWQIDHFVHRLIERLLPRLGWMFGSGSVMPYLEIILSKEVAAGHGFSDADRLERAIAFALADDAPFFLHLHLMNTHCCKYKPGRRQFAIGQDAKNKSALMDDAIVDADAAFAKLLGELEDAGKLKETLVVIYSDHSPLWGTNERIPLMFLFPDGAHAGRVSSNVQLADVAPTVLDYLNLPVPAHVRGRSLLADELPRTAPLFGVTAHALKPAPGKAEPRVYEKIGAGAPDYGLSLLSMVVCDRYYEYSLRSGAIETSHVEGHTTPCSNSAVPDVSQARKMMQRHLLDAGFGLDEKTLQ